MYVNVWRFYVRYLQKRVLRPRDYREQNFQTAIRQYSAWLKVWFADDEFEASGKLLVSRSADHYLTIEDAVTVGELLLSKLKDILDET